MPRGGKEYGYSGFYLERSGVNSGEMVETLVRPPEFALTEEERTDVLNFESELYGYIVAKGKKTLEDCLRDVRGEGTVAPLFFAHGLTEEGSTLQQGGSHLDVYKSIVDGLINHSEASADELRRMAKASMDAYVDAMTGALLADEDIDPLWLDFRRLVINPESFIEVTTNLYRARDYLTTLRMSFCEGGNLADGAKRVVIDIYLAKVNAAIVGAIPSADALLHQSKMVADSDMEDRAGRLVPSAIRRSLLDNERRDEMFRRLDYLRNGLSVDDTGRSTAVTPKVIMAGGGDGSGVEYDSPRLTHDQVERMKQVKLSPDQMAAIFTEILHRAGMLSSEPPETWTPDRTVRASDDLYQVVINPSKSSFAVNGVSGVYMVASEPRSLYDVMFVGGFHELTHINQTQSDRALAGTLKIANLKGKRASMLRESGANVRQKAAEREWTGRQKPVALTYARALQALERGDGIMEATKAFFEEKCRLFPTMSRADAAKEAAGRVLRLIGQGGFDSTAMSYAEGGLFEAELEVASDSARLRAGAITSFDLVDQIKLHKYGLLPDVSADIDWSPHIVSVLSEVASEVIRV